MAFVIPVVEHWLEREIAPWRIDVMTHRTMSERSYHGATYPLVMLLKQNFMVANSNVL